MGSLAGHTIAGTLLTFISLYFCMSIMAHFETFYKDMNNLVSVAILKTPALISIVVSALFGIMLVEQPNLPTWLNPWTQGPKLSHARLHQSIYFGYLFFGLGGFIEKYRVVPSAAMICLTVANFNASITWWFHSSMQEGTERVFHILLALITFFGMLVSSFTVWLQICGSKHITIMVFLSMYFTLLHGLMLLVIGLYYFSWEHPISHVHREVEPYQAILIFSEVVFSSISLLGGAYWSRGYCKKTIISDGLRSGEYDVVPTEIVLQITREESDAVDATIQ